MADIKHDWPKDNEHVYGPWMLKSGLPKPTEFRQCVHLDCHHFEVRDIPRGKTNG